MFLVRSGLVFVGMTAGTVRLVGRSSPLDNVGVVLVAFCAFEVAAMIQRLVWQTGMHVDVRYPCRCRMARIALLLRDEVAEILASSDRAVMTGRAGTENLRVIHGNDRAPRRRRVAVLARIRRERMVRVLARCIHTIVAAEAVVRDVGVIEIGRYPGNCRMAVVAIVATRDVARVLTLGDRAVMARYTGTKHLRVVDAVSGFPEHVVVAVLAHVGR